MKLLTLTQNALIYSNLTSLTQNVSCGKKNEKNLERCWQEFI